MPQDKDELLQVLITKYAQMYMKLLMRSECHMMMWKTLSWKHSGRSTGRIMAGS